MLVSSSWRTTLLRTNRRRTVETRRCETCVAASTAYVMYHSALIIKHGDSEVSSCVSTRLRAKEKKTGAMAGQADIPNDEASPATVQALSVKYENARGSTQGECSAYARSTIPKTLKAAFQLIRQLRPLASPGWATVRRIIVLPLPMESIYRVLADVVVGHRVLVRKYKTKKMAGRKASRRSFGETSLHVTCTTRCPLSVAYEIAFGLTDAETIVYPRKRGRRHLSFGIGVSKCTRRTTADRRYFFVRCHAFAFNGRALVGERSRSPVSLYAGTPTLSCAWPPQLALGARFVEPVQGGRTVRLAIPARSEQTQSPLQIQIINRALRNAALAPSANDALDCCAEALLHLAELARAEVTHG
ncbi:uncharacterized protein BRPE67_ACDS28120 [Caballeronia cordobensis]|nr:uncharacterized protein BRPE67_ACDS28120 [Burkholderia sp. RPE67]